MTVGEIVSVAVAIAVGVSMMRAGFTVGFDVG
jgi:hypothetical protein